MSDKIPLFIFFGIIFAVIGGILLTVLAKHLKGKIDISLPKRAYKFGDEISGSFKLHAKKDIECESLLVHLVGYKRTTSYGKDGKRNTRKEVYARFSQNIATQVKFTSGERKEYNIALKIPTYDNIFGKQEDIDLGDSTLGKLASFALNNTKRNQLSWQLQVELEAMGLDIYGKKDIFITQ